MAEWRGQLRIGGAPGESDMVEITDNDRTNEITEEEYHRGLYKPALEDLPWRKKPGLTSLS